MSIRVLYLDDELALCEIFKDLFTEAGVEVFVFTDPAEAIQYAQAHPIDVAFLDYRVPGMLGDEVAKHLPKPMPKYLITGELEPMPRFEFQGVLGKPIEAQKITDIINALRAKPRV